jgi:O-antigen/teichoic acid export membrane protein
MPLASELNAGDDPSRLRQLYVTSTRLTLAILCPLALVLCALAAPLLSAWVGPAYAPYAHLVVILTLALLIDTSQWPAGSVLQGMARHQPLAVISVITAVANLGLSLVLVQTVGVTGVALGSLIPNIVVDLGLVLPYALRVIGVRPSQALREMLLPALAPLLPAALVLFLLRQVVGTASWPALIVISGATCVTYAAGYLIAGASRMERDAYREVLSNIVRRLPTRLRPSQGI